VQVSDADAVLKAGVAAGVNLRKVDKQHVGISMDETTTLADVDTLLKVRYCGEDMMIQDGQHYHSVPTLLDT
jgi:glycine dehydrogenase